MNTTWRVGNSTKIFQSKPLYHLKPLCKTQLLSKTALLRHCPAEFGGRPSPTTCKTIDGRRVLSYCEWVPRVRYYNTTCMRRYVQQTGNHSPFQLRMYVVIHHSGFHILGPLWERWSQNSICESRFLRPVGQKLQRPGLKYLPSFGIASEAGMSSVFEITITGG